MQSDAPAHSLLGASSAHRWLNCPGSFRLSQTAPHRPTSIYAATGTLAHRLIEEAVAGLDISGAAGKTVQIEGHDITIDDELVAGVNVMLEYLYAGRSDSDIMGVEFQVEIEVEGAPVPVFGTLDAAISSAKTGLLEIVDYKNGAGVVVTPIWNPQLMFYAAGALPQAPHPVRHIKLTVIQPHAPGVAPIRSWELAPIDLAMWVGDVLIPGILKCNDPKAPLVPGSWCRFCPVAHACPALHEAAVEAAKRDFDDTHLPPDGSGLAPLLDLADRAELWIARVREFATDRLQHQVAIPGWGLVPTRATRQWTQDQTSLESELVKAGLDGGQIWEARIRSPAQLEKLLHKTRAGKRIWDQKIIPGGLIEARSSGEKLGRTGPTAQTDFMDEGGW